jgi:hypothetical protein
MDTVPCALCGRGFAKKQLTRHHCLPREHGGTSDHVVLLCSSCHSMVHATYKNSTLAANYATIQQLREAPELIGYIRWIRKQPVTRCDRPRPRRFKH